MATIKTASRKNIAAARVSRLPVNRNRAMGCNVLLPITFAA